MTGRADGWIRRTTTGCVALLALIAGTVSYLHMHMLVARHGQPGWVAALTPLSVDGMIVAASTTLLADSRSGRSGGGLPWVLLVAGGVASLAANVAMAEPTLVGQVIAAWPSFALTASYELLTRQVRRAADIGTRISGRGSRSAGGPRGRDPHPPVGWRWSASTSATGVASLRGAIWHGGRGTGPWPTGTSAGRCPAPGRLLALMAAKSGGAGSSSALPWPVCSMPKTCGNGCLSVVTG